MIRFVRRGWPAALALLLGAASSRGGDPPPPAVFPAESKAAAGRIDEVRKLLAAGKSAETVEEIQALLTASGDDLVAVGPDRDVSCRRLCHALLAALPPDALRSYRNGADPQAQKRLDAGAAARDERLLRKVVEETFCSRPGEKALDLLGDFAFERGDFAEAEQWWSFLVPRGDKANSPATFVLSYPDPQIDPARTRAKILLARLFGAASAWDQQLKDYRKEYGAADGKLAGKKGRYADILRQVADERADDGPPAALEWPTFGGDASRGRAAVAPPRLLYRLGDLCRRVNERQFSLKDRKALDEEPTYDRGAGPLLANRCMAFEPVAADGKAIVADANFVTAYDLRTGAIEHWYDAARLNGGVQPDLKLPAPPDLRYTLTVAGGRVFVRLGAQTVRDAPAADKPKAGEKPVVGDDESLLVCLSIKPGANGGHELWTLRAKALENLDKDSAYTVFEGSPLVRDGLLYIASTRFVNGRPVTRIHCYPADAAEAPAELWRQDICETREFADKDRRWRQHLLTLAGANLVYCSHSGAIVALDALTGKPAWSVRYPSRGDKTADGDPSPRDLAPCLFADGRLYVAPADYDRLLCLDAATGATLWERGPLEVVHLLGVGEGRLIFTTTTGLRAVNADDGVDAWALPDGGGGLPPAGRGLLIGDLVLWPTASKGPDSFTVYAVLQRDGEQPDDPSLLSRIPAGNLVYADGCLISADRQTLTIFTPPAMRLEEKEKQSRAEPESPAAALELARAEADAGMIDRALESCARAQRLVADLSPAKRKRLDESVRQERYAMLLDAGRRAGAAKHWDEADGYLRRAAETEFSPPQRLQALLETAGLWNRAGRPDRADAVWQGIRAADDLRGLSVEDGDGVPRRAEAFAAERIGESPRSLDRAAQATTVNPPAAAVGPPFFRSWQAALDPGEAALAVAGDALLCGGGSPGERLTCRSVDDGKLRWQAALPFVPQWAGRAGSVVVAASEGGAAGVNVEAGRVLWEFAAAPPSQAFPTEAGTVLASAARADSLGHFHLIGGRFYAVQGERRLFALDAGTGRVLWARRAPGAGLRQPFPDGRFWHVDPAGPDALLVQTSGGRRLLLDAATGRTLHEDPTAAEPWPRDPVALPDGGVLITPDARTIVLLDPASGRDVWTYALPGITTHTGEAPRLSAEPNALLVAWATNIGWRIQRLDRARGQPVWTDPPLVNVGELDVDGWSQDAEAFYGVQDGLLFARSLKDGGILWTKPLAGPPGLWKTQRAGDLLMTYPVEPRGGRFQFRWLFGALQWEGGLAPGGESGGGFPVVCCDPKTGRLIQRMNLPVTPQSFARLIPDGSGVLPACEMGPADWPPLVSFTGHDIAVALGGRAWGLSAAPK